ncbi:MAG: hypothetical protein ABEJ35_02210 [Halobacteriaceae archaeon]
MSGQRSAPSLLVRGMQAVIGGILLVGLYGGDPRVAVNAALALLGTAIPTVLNRDFRVRLGPGATLWITGSVCLHVIGMVWAYETVYWWDHLTHFVSAALIAAVAYASVTAIDRHINALYLPPRFLAILLGLLTVGLGVVWEVLEFVGRIIAVELGTDPLLVQYGLEDTMLDLAVDAVGGLLIGIVGPRRLGGAVATVEDRLFPDGSGQTEEGPPHR